MATVLVTGGAGYIGSHACKALAAQGHLPITMDNLVYGHRDAVRWGPLIEGDIRDGAMLNAVFAQHKPEVVMHFAAYAYVGESVTDPAKYYDNNIAGSLALLSAAVKAGVTRVIFSSTCATYGVPAALPIEEDTPQVPINPYGYTKLVVERMLRDFAQAHGVRSVALRYFNAAGADPDGELGERHDPETHAIPLALRAAYGQGGPFTVFGVDYDTPDGSAVRDYIHVSDLASAHVKAMEYLLNGGESTAFNLATGRGVSVRELIDAVAKATGRTVPAVFGPRRAGDPPALFASGRKARAGLNWEPRFTDMAEIVATAAPWFRP